MTTFASARERNHSSPRHSSRNLPLKLSATPFCQGLPGSISAVPIPCATIHDSRALETNSGPLSLRRKAGAPRSLTRRDSTSMNPRGADAAVHLDRQALLGELLGHRQALELLAVGAAVEHEVVGPHLVRSPRCLRARAGRSHALSRPLARHLQSPRLPQPAGPADAHPMPVTAKEDANAPIAVTRILRR